MAKWKNTKNHWSKTDKKESVLKRIQKTQFKKGQRSSIETEFTREKMLGHLISEETRKKIGKANSGHKVSKKTREKIGLANKGRIKSVETRRKQSEALKGEKCYLWKGGISLENNKIRHSIEFRLWRESVFARDNWICQKCKIRGIKLHSHHIKNFSENKELRFLIDNGITFCNKCHIMFHKRFGKKNNNNEQIIIYLAG